MKREVKQLSKPLSEDVAAASNPKPKTGQGRHMCRTAAQAVLMSLSSLGYLACAASWRHHGHVGLALLFVAISVVSFMADGVRLDSRAICSLDRRLGVVAFAWSAWVNMRCLRSTCVTAGFSLLAFALLEVDRKYTDTLPAASGLSRTEQIDYYWGMVARRGLLWHVGGALVLVLVTFYCQVL